jgi:hypothetical protein
MAQGAFSAISDTNWAAFSGFATDHGNPLFFQCLFTDMLMKNFKVDRDSSDGKSNFVEPRV